MITLSTHQNNEKQMRQLSVIPPMMYDSEQRRVKFINMNGLMDDPMKVYKSRQFMNVWTEHEKEIFREKWVWARHRGFGFVTMSLSFIVLHISWITQYRSKVHTHSFFILFFFSPHFRIWLKSSKLWSNAIRTMGIILWLKKNLNNWMKRVDTLFV